MRFGREILSIAGACSTEVDARLSFDVDATIAKARRLVGSTRAGVTAAVLIKVASTWEGIRAAESLENEGIHRNPTLLPRSRRWPAPTPASRWSRRSSGASSTGTANATAPITRLTIRVQSVRRIYGYFKKFGYPTEVMGASFRNTGQVLALAGCDLLTISPELLEQLRGSTEPVARRLDPARAREETIERVRFDEKHFRWAHNEDAMATEKLAEGIRLFAADVLKLEALVAAAR